METYLYAQIKTDPRFTGIWEFVMSFIPKMPMVEFDGSIQTK